MKVTRAWLPPAACQASALSKDDSGQAKRCSSCLGRAQRHKVQTWGLGGGFSVEENIPGKGSVRQSPHPGTEAAVQSHGEIPHPVSDSSNVAADGMGQAGNT